MHSPFEDGHFVLGLRILDEPLQIGFADTTNGVQIRTRAAVLSDRTVHKAHSYLVRYPRRLSSTLALPKTNNPPTLPLAHGKSCANMYPTTILRRA